VHQRWIFALLGRLPGPEELVGNDISTLRNLGRASVEFIKHDMDSDNEEDSAGYWMILAAIAERWGQRDLWEEARSTLSRKVVAG